MASISFKDWMSGPGLAPRWLLAPNGQRWLSAAGDQKDSQIDALKAAVKLHFASRASSGGLDAMGWERFLDRAIGETNAGYAARLVVAWNLWQYGGTALGLLSALNGVGYPDASIATRNGIYSLNPDGTLNFDAVTLYLGEFWNRFSVFWSSAPSGWTTQPAADDPRVELIRRTISTWKSSFAICNNFTIKSGGRLWGVPAGRTWGTGTWDQGESWVYYI